MAKISVYRCNKCKTLFPSDYYEQWGRKYGKMLGRDVCCEALNSRYHRPFVVNKQQPDRTMYPLEVCKGTLSYVEMESADVVYPVFMENDRKYAIRAPIMQSIQASKKPELMAHLKTVVAAYKSTGRSIPSHLLELE